MPTLRNKLPRIRIKAEFGTPEFETEVDAVIATQIELFGNEDDHINAQKQRNEACPALPDSTRLQRSGPIESLYLGMAKSRLRC